MTQDMAATEDAAGRDAIGHNGKCNALKRQLDDDGTRRRCTLPAGWGTTHVGIGACRKHGGSTRNHARFAEVEQARRDVALWGGRRDIHPADALLELVQTKAAEVAYWRFRVAEIAEEDLTYGVTKVKTGGDDYGTTEEAKPHIALTLLHKAEADLAAYAAASLKAGVDEARVRIAESQAAWAIELLRRGFALAQVPADEADRIIITMTQEAIQQ